MLALRRTALSIRSQGYRQGAAHLFFAKQGVLSDDINDERMSCVKGYILAIKLASVRGFWHMSSFPGSFTLGTQGLASQADARSSDEEDSGFPELDTVVETGATLDEPTSGGNEEELISEPELYDDPEDSGVVSSADEETKKKIMSLLTLVVNAPHHSLWNTIDRWVEEGNSLNRMEIIATILKLRKRKMYMRALQLLEWVEANKCYDWTETDHGSHLDLIAKVHGLNRTERYLEKVPKSFQGEWVYRSLLVNCVRMLNMKKAEEIFNKMTDLGFPLTTSTCNQLLLLYKKLDKKKIADVLLMMEKENVKPSQFTYKLLIDAKGRSNDMEGIAQVLNSMKAEGVEPNLDVQSTVVKFYINDGFRKKAEEVLKEMEGGGLTENRMACIHLLPLYACLHDAENVSRVWRVCEESPRWGECLAAIEAWGELGNVEKAEEVFEKMQKLFQHLSTKYYTALLTVYTKNSCLDKAKNLVKKMSEKGIMIGPYTWDALIKLYVEAGDVEKADLILENAILQKGSRKPFYSSYLVILNQYAKRGDVQNAEKVFQLIREAGYKVRAPQYEALLQAYVNGKTPAFGLRERMKADNIFPNKNMSALLGQVEGGFKKKGSIVDLLD